MPRRKKADDTPVENAEVTAEEQNITTDSEPNAVESDAVDAVEAAEAVDPPVQEEEKPAQKKRKTRKKADESVSEEVSQPTESVVDSKEEETVSSVSEAEELRELEEESTTFSAEEMLEDIMAQQAEAAKGSEDDLTTSEVTSDPSTPSEAPEYDSSDNNISESTSDEEKTVDQLAKEYKDLKSRRSVNTSDQSSGNVKVATGASVFGGSTGRDEAYQELLILNELRRYISSGIPLFCRVVGSRTHNGEISALCQPIKDKLRSIIIYVPFSEMDIPSARELTNKEKLLLLNGCINSVLRVCVLRINGREKYGEGSVRLGNLRARRDAYYKGRSFGIDRNAETQVREIIGVGTQTNALVEFVHREYIRVNISGVRTQIKRHDLSYKYIADARELYQVGQQISVKITYLHKHFNQNYDVEINASAKALQENQTIEALHNFAEVGKRFLATIAFIPKIGSKAIYPMANADLGFNIQVQSNLSNEPFYEGSKVLIKIERVERSYALGVIQRLIKYDTNG